MPVFGSGTDKDWEAFGREDPYFGVLADERFRRANLTDEARAAFFQSGADYVDALLATVRRHLDPDFAIGRALDFGCGVGRLVVPLAAVSREVTGVDVSEAMLQEARRNCDARGLGNVTLARSDDALSALTGPYDFIHSFIVFQHIPVRRGERIFRALLGTLRAGGVGVVHFTYAKASRARRVLSFVRTHVPLVANLINLLKGRRFFAPQMQMHTYDLNRLVLLLQGSGVTASHVEFTDHGGEYGVVLFFRKPAPR